MELKSLIEATNRMMQEHNTAMMISRNEAKASTRQVQWLTKYNQALSNQVLLLMNAVETLSRASSCDSTISSMSATLEEVRQSQANNPNPIPVEVVTHEVR